MTKIIEKLKNSPIRNLSLTSLENSHTEFLKWVGDNYPLDFVKIFDDSADTTEVKYEREKSYKVRTVSHEGKEGWRIVRLDLEINTNDGDIYIANKLKSFPDMNQLESYRAGIQKEAGKQKFILLSLVPQEALKLFEPWEYMDYHELCKKFKNVFNSDFKYENDYHKYLIEDYTDTIGNMASVFSKVYEQNALKYDFYNKDKIAELKELGLQDIYAKFKISELTTFIGKKLPKYSPTVDLDLYGDFNKRAITIENTLWDYKIGIQIQENQYRYFIASEKLSAEYLARVAEKLKEKELWFVDTQDPSGKSKHKNFCSYVAPHYKMLYKYRKIDGLLGAEAMFEAVANQVKTDMDKYVGSLSEIEKVTQLVKKEFEDKRDRIRKMAEEAVLREYKTKL